MEPTDTKGKILDAAEKLFAEQGISSTSVRHIIAEAGVNLAAVHYHFGSKDALIRAVFFRRIEPVNTERSKRLETVEFQTSSSIEAIIKAFIEPAMYREHTNNNGKDYALSLMGRIHSEPPEIQRLIFGLFEETMKRFVAAFQTALPHIPPHVLYLRFKFMVGSMVMILMQIAGISEGNAFQQELIGDRQAITQQLTQFMAAGFRAPADVEPKAGEA